MVLTNNGNYIHMYMHWLNFTVPPLIKPAHVWFLEIAFVQEVSLCVFVCVCVCVCVRPRGHEKLVV